MNLTNHLNQLRDKPDLEKSRIAFFYASLITGLIFIVWLFSLAISLGNLGRAEPAPIATPPISNIMTSNTKPSPSWFSQRVVETRDFVDSVGRGARIAGTKLKIILK